MQAAERRVVRALEQTLELMLDREGIGDELRAAMGVFSQEMHIRQTDPVEFVLREMKKLTSEQRQHILAEFCVTCGGDSPCNCWRDD